MSRARFVPVPFLVVALLAGCAGPEKPEPEAPVPPPAVGRGPGAGPGAPVRFPTEAQAPRAVGPGAVGQRLVYSSARVPGPYVALTFDDGPHVEQTPRLLDALARRGARATFFVLGQRCEAGAEILRRMVREGHEIGNHSWSHPQFTRLSDEGVRSQLRRTHDLVRSITGVAMRALRPPYGSTNDRLNRWITSEFGYRIVLWSVDPRDWRDRSAPVVTGRILAETNSGSIVLVHDIHASSVDAIPAALDALAAKGYRFVTVSELLDMERPIAAAPPSGDVSTIASDAR